MTDERTCERCGAQPRIGGMRYIIRSTSHGRVCEACFDAGEEDLAFLIASARAADDDPGENITDLTPEQMAAKLFR